ncbi:MAG: glycosyltransferase family 4 protein [Anaerolineae bacterium]|nr:glycosyltransferase family 4 protein [Anaerolineae bacterium]
MRIGIDYTAAARQGGGIGRYTRELVAALLRLESSHRYALFAAVGGLKTRDWRSEIENLQSLISALKFRAIPITDDWLHRLWQRLRLPIPVEAITGPLDIFYSPDFVLPPTLRATRTLLTVHDLSFLHYPDAFVPSLRAYLERVVPCSVARADRVLADSESTRKDLITYFGISSEKVQVLYSGVDERFRPDPEPEEKTRLKARYGLGDQPYILSVGTLQPRKNYVRLIKAFANLQPANLQLANLQLANLQLADLRLAIAGGCGWLYEGILAEAEKHGDRVRVLGFVDDADLPALFRNAALFAFPSLYEGFGLPVLEAMACGTPVVCSNASSLPEVAGDAALMVDPFDVDALAQAMARALEDVDLRQEMVAKGLAQAERFTWEGAARQLLDLFEAL